MLQLAASRSRCSAESLHSPRGSIPWQPLLYNSRQLRVGKTALASSTEVPAKLTRSAAFCIWHGKFAKGCALNRKLLPWRTLAAVFSANVRPPACARERTSNRQCQLSLRFCERVAPVARQPTRRIKPMHVEDSAPLRLVKCMCIMPSFRAIDEPHTGLHEPHAEANIGRRVMPRDLSTCNNATLLIDKNDECAPELLGRDGGYRQPVSPQPGLEGSSRVLSLAAYQVRILIALHASNTFAFVWCAGCAPHWTYAMFANRCTSCAQLTIRPWKTQSSSHPAHSFFCPLRTHENTVAVMMSAEHGAT